MKPVSKPFKRSHNLLAGAQFADCYSLIVSGQSLNATIAAERVAGRGR